MEKSTPPWSIGDVAAQVGVATSTVRYYDRIGLVVADGRASGRRAYDVPTVRRLVFVQMMQDAGLTLDDIRRMIGAEDNAAWKAIAHDRLATLDEEIARLRHARELLDGALLCRFDHPLDECGVMNAEIDRRLGDGPATGRENE